jgi:hypothetical protein
LAGPVKVNIRARKTDKESNMPYTELKDYPAGTRISIGERFFVRANYSTFWTEEHEIPGNCNSRPSASLQNLEISLNTRHIVVLGDLVDRHEMPL